MIGQCQDWIVEGEYIDAKDKHNDWQAGLVLSKLKTNIKVRFDGWPAKFDEFFTYSCPKIRPFRSITRGYTGQKTNLALREHWKFSVECHQKRLGKLKQCIMDISAVPVREIVQFLRGENYFYIDYLLTLNYKSRNDVLMTLEYFQSHLLFARNYLANINALGILNWQAAVQSEVCDEKAAHSAALADAYHEILDSVNSITGACLRLTLFFKTNEKILKEVVAPELSYEAYISRILAELNFCDQFSKFSAQIVEISSKASKESVMCLPFPLLKASFHLLVGLDRMQLNRQEKLKQVNQLYQVMQRQMRKVDLEQTKQYEQELQQLFLQIRLCLFKYPQKDDAINWTSLCKINLWVMMIRSDTLQRKLRGLQKINKFYETAYQQKEYEGIELPKELFRKQLRELSFLQVLFEQNSHPQILRKGCELAVLFYRKNIYSVEELLHIWSCCAHKHEAVRKIIFQFWLDLTPHLSNEDLQAFVGVILDAARSQTQKQENMQILIEDWEIIFLFNLCSGVSKWIEQEKLKSISFEDEQSKPCDKISLQLLQCAYLKILQFENSSTVQSLVLHYAKVVAASEETSFIVRSLFEGIERKQSITLNVTLLAEVLSESFGKVVYVPEKAFKVLFACMHSDIHSPKFVGMVLKLLNRVQQTISKSQPQLELSEDDFKQVWSALTEVQTDGIREILYAWMLRKCDANGEIFQINANFSYELRQYIFVNILSSSTELDYISMSLQQLHLFLEYMIYVNEANEKLQVRVFMGRQRVIRVKEGDLEGYKNIWDIFLNCKNYEVIERLARFILVVNFNFVDSFPLQARKERLEILLNRIEKHIKDGHRKANVKLMKHSLMLLNKIVVSVKGCDEQEVTDCQVKVRVRVIREGGVHFDAQISLTDTYKTVKAKIGKAAGLPVNKFSLKTLKGEEISRQLLQVPFNCMQEKILKLVKTKYEEEPLEKFILSFMKLNMEHTLIEMLQNELVCEDAYIVLEELGVNENEGQELFEKLLALTSSETHERLAESPLQKHNIYYHMFFLKVLTCESEKEEFLCKFICSEHFPLLVDKLKTPVDTPLVVKLLTSLAETLHSLPKKAKFGLQVNPTTQAQIVLSKLSPVVLENSLVCMQSFSKYIISTNIGSRSNTSSIQSARLFVLCFNLLELNIATGLLLGFLLEHPVFQRLLQLIFLNSHRNLKFILTEKLKKELTNSRANATLDDQCLKRLANLFIKQMYRKIRSNEESARQQGRIANDSLLFYKLVAEIISNLTSDILDSLSMNELDFYESVIHAIEQERDPIDANEPANSILNGHLIILVSLCNKRPERITIELIDFLLYQCLFYTKTVQLAKGPDIKCKKPETIKSALELLFVLCKAEETNRIQGVGKAEHKGDGADKQVYLNNKYTSHVLECILPFHRIDFWRNSAYWNVLVENEVKAKYVGLENPGCICYHNSLMQQLFMIQDFKSAILALDLREPEEDDKAIESESSDIKETKDSCEGKEQKQKKLELLVRLKELFLRLSHSQEIALNPTFFTKTIKNGQNKPMIRIFEQMDIDEFSSILFDRIEQLVPFLHSSDNFVKQLFGGVYAHQIVSKECPHTSEREEQFLSISLDVKKNIMESFNALVKSQLLDGENKYYCDLCDKKVTAEKGLTLKRLPRHLMLCLKRFEFDYEVDAKIKINDYCEFPEILNLKDYSQQQMNRKLQQPLEPENLDPVKMVEEAEEMLSQGKLPDSHFLYRLKGVVVHTGSADSGHYYSFIQDQDKKWFEFNDDRVTPFDPSRLPEESYGGKDEEDVKIKNAYMLFYERIQNDPLVPSLLTKQENQESSANNMVSEAGSGISNQFIVQSIEHKNKNINKYRLLFSKDYSQFVNKLTHSNNFWTDNLEVRYDYFLTYFLLIKLRDEGFPQICLVTQQLLLMFRQELFRHKFISVFHSSLALEEFYVYCSSREKCKILSHLLLEACKMAIEAHLCRTEANNGEYMELFSTDELPLVVSRLFDNIIQSYLNNGNINELGLILRKCVDWQQKKGKRTILNYLVEKGLFMTIYDNLFGFTYNKEEKEKKLKAFERIESCPLIATVTSEGRKFVGAQEKESWHLLYFYFQTIFNMVHQNEGLQKIYETSSKEMIMLKAPLVKMAKLLPMVYECSNTKSVVAMCQMLNLYISCSDTIQGLVMNLLEKALKDYESTKYRQYQLFILKLITFKSQKQHEVIRRIINLLRVALKANDKYFIECDLIHQWILKYAQSSPEFLAALSKMRQFIEEIITWSEARGYPNADIIKKHKSPNNEKLLQRLHNIHISAEPTDYQRMTIKKIARFQSILQGDFFSHGVVQEPRITDEYPVNTKVEIFESATWIPAVVIENQFGMLKTRTLVANSSESICWEDSERIRLYVEIPVHPQPAASSSSFMEDEDNFYD